MASKMSKYFDDEDSIFSLALFLNSEYMGYIVMIMRRKWGENVSIL